MLCQKLFETTLEGLFAHVHGSTGQPVVEPCKLDALGETLPHRRPLVFLQNELEHA
ncbi:hypothetical protein D3C80_2217210 [compost metagenome]